MEKGEWYIFYDLENQAGLFIDTNRDVLKLLESYSPAKIPLKTNCRNTLEIINAVKDRLSMDMGSTGTGNGPDVEFLEEDNSDNPASQLARKLDDLLKKGISASSITILSPLSFDESSLQYLPNKLRNKISELDDYSIRNFPISTISFSEIRNFKGLENEVILVLDLPKIVDETADLDKVLYYTAMTRARSLLICVWGSRESHIYTEIAD